MNVLSLFDGMSCGRVALERAGIHVKKYYASEIDKYAIQVSRKNYLDIIRLGDIDNWESWDIDWSSIGLILAGSPCQGFSFAGKQLAFDDKRSALFFRFAEILAHVQSLNPNVRFLLENVRMKKDYEKVITSAVGVEPVMINSALVSAQNRQRLYWCNWHVEQPADRKILLKDILHNSEAFTDKSQTILSTLHKESVKSMLKRKKMGLLASDHLCSDTQVKCRYQLDMRRYIVPPDKALQILDKEANAGKIGFFRADSQANRVYSIHGKSVTLCGDAGDDAAKTGQYLFGCITPDRIEKRQNGQRFSTGEKFYTLTAQDRHGVLIDGYIRKLTPIECERLQTLPDNYTAGVSNTQRYKMLGNGWTVDVIAHILRALELKD